MSIENINRSLNIELEEMTVSPATPFHRNNTENNTILELIRRNLTKS